MVAAAAKSLQACPTLCDPIDGSPPGSPVPGILQARTLEWAAISFSNACMHAKSLQSCPTLCDPMDSSPPGSSVHGSLQARTLKWVAISCSKKKKAAWLEYSEQGAKVEVRVAGRSQINCMPRGEIGMSFRMQWEAIKNFKQESYMN